jgi:hypothetical protein
MGQIFNCEWCKTKRLKITPLIIKQKKVISLRWLSSIQVIHSLKKNYHSFASHLKEEAARQLFFHTMFTTWKKFSLIKSGFITRSGRFVTSEVTVCRQCKKLLFNNNQGDSIGVICDNCFKYLYWPRWGKVQKGSTLLSNYVYTRGRFVPRMQRIFVWHDVSNVFENFRRWYKKASGKDRYLKLSLKSLSLILNIDRTWILSNIPYVTKNNVLVRRNIVYLFNPTIVYSTMRHLSTDERPKMINPIKCRA